MIDTKTSTIKEWLEAWDRGEDVPSIEMGGMGPGYEQALQICAFETVRFVLANEEEFRRIVAIQDEEKRRTVWQVWSEKVDDALFAEGAPCEGLGLSGAQVSAAKNLTSVVFHRGLAAMDDEGVKDRRITVNKKWSPEARAEAEKYGAPVVE